LEKKGLQPHFDHVCDFITLENNDFQIIGSGYCSGLHYHSATTFVIYPAISDVGCVSSNPATKEQQWQKHGRKSYKEAKRFPFSFPMPCLQVTSEKISI
jgi:hypothetical protein